MKILDRYLIQQFSRNLALVMGALVAIYLLIDFFERVDNFTAVGLGVKVAAYYLLFKIPLIVEQLMPVSLLLAGIITLGILNRHHELMALKAGGLSVRRIARPLLLAAFFFTGLALINSQWLLPPTIKETNRIWYQEVNQQIPRGIERGDRIYYRGIEGIYSFARPQDIARGLQGFSLATLDRDFNLDRLLTAAEAHWEAGTWTLLDGQLQQRTAEAEMNYQTTLFSRKEIKLADNPADFFLAPHALAERPLSVLLTQALAETASPRRHEARLTLHQKISYIFLGLPLLLIGMPLLLALHQGRGRDLALAIPISCIVAFAVWGLWSIGQSLAAAAHLTPLLASWLIHFSAGGLGLYFLSRQDA